MNYEEIVCDANNLYRAYKVSVKSSKWKESTQKFMMNFLRYIFEIQDDLINRTLQNGPTQEFELHERGRIRPITSIQIRDRIVRHSLCDEVLLPEVRKHIENVTTAIAAVTEAYPELKSNENYKELMNELSITENLIAEYRENYNKQIKEYNRYVRKFPTRFFLNILGYETQQYQYLDYGAPVDAPQNLFGD